MGSFQEPEEDRIAQGFRQKTGPYVAPLVNGAVDSLQLTWCKLLRSRHHHASDHRVPVCRSSRSFESTPACTSSSLPKSQRTSDKRFRYASTCGSTESPL